MSEFAKITKKCKICGKDFESWKYRKRKYCSPKCRFDGMKIHKSLNERTKYTYTSWRGMMQRCYLKTSLSYKRYGDVGIVVCDRWHSFENFLKDMGERPEGSTLDRFPNDSKIYSYKTCRWATKTEQARNKKAYKCKSSKYKGVHEKTGSGYRIKKWQAMITIDGKRIDLGRYYTEKEAAIAYNKAALKYFGNNAIINKEVIY